MRSRSIENPNQKLVYFLAYNSLVTSSVSPGKRNNQILFKNYRKNKYKLGIRFIE